MDNTSGQGKSALVPPEVDRWNWGAFLLNWVWGIGNRTFIALLMFVPFVNFVMPFVLGFKGSSWAWRNKRWQSIEDFKRVQRKWALWSLPVLAAIAFLIGGAFFLVMASIKNSDAYRLGVSKLQSNADAIAVLGAPVSTGLPSGRIEVSGPSGKAALSFGVEGSKTKGTVYLLASKALGTWEINRIELKVEGQRNRIDLNKIGRTPLAASKPVVHSQVALESQSKPAKGAQQTLQAHILIVGSHAEIAKWVQSHLDQLGEPGGDNVHQQTISTGTKMYVPVIATGYRSSASGRLNLSADLEFISPSGTVLFAKKKCCSADVGDPRTPGLVVLNPVIDFTIDPGDPLGTYTVRASVTDGFGSASASKSFSVETNTGTKRGSTASANTGGAAGAGGTGPATGAMVGGITAGMEAAAATLAPIAVAASSSNGTNNAVSTTTRTTK
jgi:Cytochrome oxidase complex assembly protein 1